MIDKNQDIDKLAEDILTAYGKELCKSRKAYFDALEDDSVPDPPFFAEPVRKKMRTRRTFRRALILVAVLVLIMGLVVISSEGVKEKMFNYFADEKEGHTDLSYLDGEDDESKIPAFELGYVPEGYELLEHSSDIFGWKTVYGNDKEQYIHFNVNRSEDYNMSVDNDTFKQREILVNSYQALLFYDDMNSAIIWQVGDYTLDLLTGLSTEETIEIARNVKLKE